MGLSLTRKPRRLGDESVTLGYLFLAPVILFLLVFIVIAIFYCAWMSLFQWKIFDMGASKTFVALENYARLFKDPIFATSMGNTFTVVVGALAAEITLGFLIALTLWSMGKPSRVVQSLILLPMIMSPIIVGLMWRYMYDTQFGFVNFIIRRVLHMPSVAWLGDPRYSLLSVILVDIWQMTPFVILVLYAGMTSISQEWIEAAQVDGARFWQIVRVIVLPSIRPMIAFSLLMRSMDLFKIFDTIYSMTGGGPGYSSQTVSLYIYKMGFSQSDMGYAMALSVVTLITILFVSQLMGTFRKGRWEE